MVEAGALHQDDRLELLDGELVPMSPQGPPHSGVTVLVRTLLERAFGPSHHVRDHSPLRAGPHDLPEPDLLVVRGDPRDYLRRLPTGDDSPLVIEVAESSRARDRRKARTYAAAGIPMYWLVDVARRRVEVRTRPGDDGYATCEVLGEDAELVVPTPTPTALRIADLLPPSG